MTGDGRQFQQSRVKHPDSLPQLKRGTIVAASSADSSREAVEQSSDLINQASSMLGMIIEASPQGSMIAEALDGVRTVLDQAQASLLRAAAAATAKPRALTSKISG